VALSDERKQKRVSLILSGAGGLLLVVWLVAALTPALRGMLDFGASFLLNFVVTAALWWAVRQSASEAKSFWRWLALGWGLNVVGNLAWAAYDFVVGESLAILSWIDGFYIARYILVFVAFWRYPRRALRAQWTSYVILLASATSLVWLALFRPVMATLPQPLLYFFGGALYPIMDVALVYAALLTWAYVADARMRTAARWLTLAMGAYGVANWINFGARSASLDAASFAAGLFWLLADVGTGTAALYAVRRPTAPAPMTPLASPSTSTLAWLTLLAAVPAVGLALVDWIVRSAVDGMLLTCAALALVAIGYHWLFFRRMDHNEDEP